jgi:hypothetical protein
MRERQNVLTRKAFGQRLQLIMGLLIFFRYRFLKGTVDFCEAVPTQCSLEMRKDLGFYAGSNQGVLEDKVLSADPRTMTAFGQF